jgi:hypothetical protein
MAIAARLTVDSEIPLWVFGPAGVGVCLATLTPNPELTVAAVMSLAMIVLLLRRRSEPAALLFIFGMQWLQGSLKVFHADVLGIELWKMVDAHNVEAAVYLTLAWTVCIAIGARIAITIFKRYSVQQLPSSDVTTESLFLLYGAWSVAEIALHSIAPASTRQLLLAFANLRFAVVFAIFVVALKTRRGLPLMWVTFGIEMAIGALSFFSDFKVPLFLLVLAAISSGKKLRPRQSILALVAAMVTLYLGVVWSAIKLEYRDRLNGGTGAQVVAIDRHDQIGELVGLFENVDSGVLSAGRDALMERIAYVDYFAYTIDYVPAVKPHEGGKLWLDAVLHILTPRMLFPEKAELRSDTEVTAIYTGLDLYRTNRETSISMGLPAITYVDFGSPMMLLVAILVGLLHGATYSYFWSRGPSHALAQGFATVVVIGHTTIEPSAEKLLGGEVTMFVVAFAVWKSMPTLMKLVNGLARIMTGSRPDGP